MAVNWRTVPDAARYPVNPTDADISTQIAQYDACKAMRIIQDPASGIRGAANGLHYQRMHGANIWPGLGKTKTWWMEQDRAFIGVHVARNADLSWATEPNVPSAAGPQWTTRRLMDFYIARAADPNFRLIPRFVKVQYTAEEAGRVQPLPVGPQVDFPLWIMTDDFQSTARPDLCYRVDPDSGAFQWTTISEYEVENPLVIGGSVQPIDDASVSDRVRRIKGWANSGQPARVIDQNVREIYIPALPGKPGFPG